MKPDWVGDRRGGLSNIRNNPAGHSGSSSYVQCKTKLDVTIT